jgi:hypothetical protein
MWNLTLSEKELRRVRALLWDQIERNRAADLPDRGDDSDELFSIFYREARQ